MKVIDAERYRETGEEVIVGMGLYNTMNVKWEGVETGARQIENEEMVEEYEAGEIKT